MVHDAGRIAVGFGEVLRGNGVAVTTADLVTFAEALDAVGPDWPERVYWAGRASLVRRPEDVVRYDEAFAAFWLDRPYDADEPPLVPPPPVVALEEPVQVARYSAREVLRRKDFAAYSPEEEEESRRLMADLRLAGAFRRTRRRRRSTRSSGRRLDLRRTAKAALRTSGEPVRRSFTEPARRHRRVVLLCDVSGSMEPYSRALVRFLHASVAGGTRVEAFALGTRLTRMTRELSTRHPGTALAAAARSVPDWSGGTRLGEGLRAFNDMWGARGMARGAVVVVLSDGWDRGDALLLAEQMARLRRIAYKVVWVNPLKAAPGYAPLAQGMAAALPHVDEFVEGHSIAALERLAEVISDGAGRGWGPRPGEEAGLGPRRGGQQ